MSRKRTGAAAGSQSQKKKAKMAAKLAPSKRRKKPGPKSGRRAWEARQKRKALADEKEKFAPNVEQFIALLSEGKTHKQALLESRLDWSRFNRLNAGDLGIQARYTAAKEAGEVWRRIERLDEMHRRAVDGVPEPVVSGGKSFGDRVVYSDNMLTTLVKADHPDKFADRTKGSLTINPEDELAGVVAEIEKDILKRSIPKSAPAPAPEDEPGKAAGKL